MKKIILLFTFIATTFIAAQAQTEISGYLDADPTDGIGGGAATFDLFSAVQACRSLVHDGKTDWYLPSAEEICLFANGDSDTGTTPGCTGTNCNWTSNIAWLRTSFGGDDWRNTIWQHTTAATGGVGYTNGTTGAFRVRCVR